MAYKSGTIIQDFKTTLGPASYATATKPTVALTHLKNIRSMQDVKIKADGYLVDVVSVLGNVVTYRVRFPAPEHTHVLTGDLLATHDHTEGSLAFTGAPLADHDHTEGTLAFTGVPLGDHGHTEGSLAFTGGVLADHDHTEGTLGFAGNPMADHQHDITTVALAGGGSAITEAIIAGPLETAGAGQVNTGAVDTASAGTPDGAITGSTQTITAGTPDGTIAGTVLAITGGTPAGAVAGTVTAITAGTPDGAIAGSTQAITGGTISGTNANQTLAIASEVPDATPLDGVTFRVSAIGYPSNVRAQYA